VVRSKLVPDFALTVHFIHLVLTSLYSHSIPYSLFWWSVQGASAAIMTLLGVWSCQWRELRPISFGFGGLVPPANGPAPANGTVSQLGNGVEEGLEMVARGEP
jgi:protein SYS1